MFPILLHEDHPVRDICIVPQKDPEPGEMHEKKKIPFFVKIQGKIETFPRLITPSSWYV